MSKEDLTVVGYYNVDFNSILNIELNIDDLAVYMSNGLSSHMIKRKHFKALKYLNNISDILSFPDYIGINPNETECSIELVKKYDNNILVGIKLDKKENYLYVSTMFDIQDSKLNRRLFSGRLKTVNIDKNKEP